MGNIAQLKDKDGNLVYPISSTSLVYDNLGNNMDTLLGRKANVHEHPYKPSNYVPNWSEVTGKPSSFPPSTHNHDASYASKDTEHTHTNKSVIDGISSAKVSEWNSKSTFSGNYNDLTNKPAIPSISGLATELYVNTELTKKADLHSHPYKSDSYVPSWGEVTGKPSTFTPSSHDHNTLYASKSSEHTHANKSVIDGISSDKITEWDGKSTFSGNYNDLSNKPTIPTVDVNKSYVDTELSKKADTHTHPYKPDTYVPSWNDITGKPSTFTPATHNHDTAYASKSSEHTHANKSVIDGISSAKVTEWNSKSNFSGNYNDLSNKPTIPTKLSQLQNDIIPSSGILNVDVPSSQFAMDSSTGLYKATVNHSFGTTNIMVSIMTSDTNESVTAHYKIVDGNSLLVYMADRASIRVTMMYRDFVNVGQGGATISDSTISPDKVWSSTKVNTEIGKLYLDNTIRVFNLVLLAPNSTKYEVVVNEQGTISTKVTSATYSGEVIIEGDNGQRWKVSVDNSGVISTQTGTGTALPTVYSQASLPSALIFRVSVTTSGSLYTAPISDLNVLLDTSVSTTRTWSSYKIQEMLNSMQSVIQSLQSEITTLKSNKLDKDSIIISNTDPSGGKDGDIFIKY